MYIYILLYFVQGDVLRRNLINRYFSKTAPKRNTALLNPVSIHTVNHGPGGDHFYYSQL
jgi:hypothetical protein